MYWARTLSWGWVGRAWLSRGVSARLLAPPAADRRHWSSWAARSLPSSSPWRLRDSSLSWLARSGKPAIPRAHRRATHRRNRALVPLAQRPLVLRQPIKCKGV